MTSHPQLPLGIRLADAGSFANFFPAANAEVLAHLQHLAAGDGERIVYLWGGAGAGKTHLLHALCRAVAHRNLAVAYVPLRHGETLAPDMLEGLEHCALVCVDDVDVVAGHAAWEEAVFHLFNRVAEQHNSFVAASRSAPTSMPFRLADLRSRLTWGLVLEVHELPEADRSAALQLRARQRGFELPDDVVGYLLRRCPRDPASLFALLDRLDDASLAAQRKLTIPFVRELL